MSDSENPAPDATGTQKPGLKKIKPKVGAEASDEESVGSNEDAAEESTDHNEMTSEPPPEQQKTIVPEPEVQLAEESPPADIIPDGTPKVSSESAPASENEPRKISGSQSQKIGTQNQNFTD